MKIISQMRKNKSRKSIITNGLSSGEDRNRVESGNDLSGNKLENTENMCAAASAAKSINSNLEDCDLAYCIAQWQSIPDTVRVQIIALIRSATNK